MADPGDVVQQGALALLVIDRVFSFVREKRGKTNGHSSVRPQDASEFWLLQKEIERKVNTLLDEVMDPAVKRHHRDRR
jgi:hypothetical protein